MDINDTPNRIRYSATAGQQVFTIPFEFFAEADIKVWRNGTALSYSASPTTISQFSVFGALNEGGGTITLGAGATLNDDILIIRDIPVERLGDFPVSGPFFVSSLNTQLDKLTCMVRDLEAKYDQRVFRVAITDLPETINDLPTKANRASKIFAFDANGQPVAKTTDELVTNHTWGGITGTLSNQTDLQTALDGKASASHVHAATEITGIEEYIQDTIGTTIRAGSGISVSYSDTLGTFTITNTGGGGGGGGGGDVTGPAFATAGNFAALDATGKILSDSGVSQTTINTSLALKANLASPTFTGTPAAPTAAAYTDTTQIATTAHVKATVSSVPENAQTGTTYTLVLADAGKMVSLANAAAITLTVPPNSSVAFPVGTRIDLLQYGAGQVTVAAGAGVTLYSRAARLKIAGQYGGATLWKKATDTWLLLGDLTA